MTFISNKIESDYQPSEGYTYKENFWDTYSAGVGNVLHEEISFSRVFAKEAYNQRKINIQQMVESGELGREVIDANRDRRGRVDYDRIAKALNDERIKTDEQVAEEQKEILRSQREYGERTLARGPAIAGFLGKMHGYMNDPFNTALMFAGGAGIVKNGLSTGQAVFRAGVRGGTIAATSEALIQPFVFDYKQEIDSPYSFEDSLLAITTAAIGGAALDSTITGLKSYFTRVKADINKLEADGYDVPKEVIAAKQKIDELEMKLEGDPLEDADAWRVFDERDFSYKGVETRVKAGTKDAKDLALFDEYQSVKGDAEAVEAIRMREVKEMTKNQLMEIKRRNALEMEYNSPKPKVEVNQKPRLKVKSGQDLTGNARIKKEMESQGLLDDYNTELQEFNQIDDVQIEIEGYTGSSKEYVKMMDDEVETIEQLSRCAIG